MKMPIVSVCVVTYNSQDTVIETLESIYRQTYQPIHIIISDDCSKDATVKICLDWLEQHKERFLSAKMLTSVENRGITFNCNKAVQVSEGEWVKVIAGDDILFDNYVSENVLIALRYSPSIIFSKIEPFGNLLAKNYTKQFAYGNFCCSSRQIYYKLLQKNFISAPSAFINKSFLISNGCFDEAIPNIEDWPFWLKAFRLNEPIIFINKTLVKYRMGNSSISISLSSHQKFMLSMRLLSRHLIKESKQHSLLMWLYLKSKYFGETKIAYYISILLRLINPITYYLYYIDKKADYFYSKLMKNDNDFVAFFNYKL